jgi:hypothetical protein
MNACKQGALTPDGCKVYRCEAMEVGIVDIGPIVQQHLYDGFPAAGPARFAPDQTASL